MTAALALDRPATFTAARWSPDLVRARLVEAFEVEARLPEGKGPRRSSGSPWPTMSREFEDLVGWSDEARQAVWDDWARAKGAHAWEVTRYEEAIAWLALLKDYPGEQRCLHVWAQGVAKRVKRRKLYRRMDCSKSMFYRRRDEGSERIADELNKKAVAVR